MARKAKWENNLEKPDFIEKSEPQGELYDPSDDADIPVATEKHRIVTEFVTERPVNELAIPSASPKPAPQPVVVQEPLVFSPQDEVEAFLQEISVSTAGWELLIYRLPRFELNGKTDPQSRMRVGKLPFSWDYEQDIQRRWARPGESNHFLIVAKKDGQHVKNGTLPVFSCEPLPLEERITSGVDQLPPTPQPVAVPIPAPYPAPIVEQQPPPSPKEQLKEALELVKMVQSITGTNNAANPAPAPLDPEIAVLQVLAKDETFGAKLSKGLLSKFFGDVKEDPDPWADIAKEALRSGQAAELLKVGIASFGDMIRGFFPQPQTNAPAAAAQPPAQQPPQMAPMAGPMQQQQMTPAEELLSFVLQQCHRNAPREPVADQIFTFAEQIEETDPLNSVDWYIRAFALMPTDQALQFVNQQVPGSEQVTNLPHAKQWTAELQELLKQNYEGEGDDDQHQPGTENAG